MAAPNRLIVQIDGPNMVTGELAVVTRTGLRRMSSAMLCRCGLSQDKPFCDGAHVKGAFRDPALLPVNVETVAVGEGPLTIRPVPNGPNHCEGPLTICASDGRTASANQALVCRCGGSRRKPYCDGTHAQSGFRG